MLHGDVMNTLKQTFNEVEQKILKVKEEFVPPKPREEAESQPPSPRAKPKKKKLIDITKDKATVNEYLDKRKNFTDKIRDSLVRLPDTEVLLEGVDAIRGRSSNKKDISKDIREQIENYMVSKGYVTAVDV